MYQRLVRFWQDDSGQDLIEYSLLICFIAIATMWIMGAGRPAVNQIWISSNSTIANASTFAGS